MEGNILYKINDTTGKTVTLGEKILPEYALENLFLVFDFLEKIDGNTKTLMYENETLGDIRTPSIENTPIIYFSLENNPMYAVESVHNLKNEKLEYIDLRVQGRIYYK